MATSAKVRNESPYVFELYPYETRWVPVGAVLIPEYQHPPYPHAVAKLKENFDRRSYGFITISERQDGSLWALDGQTRLKVHQELGIPTIKAEIRTGLTISEEALIYRFLSLQTSRGAADQHLARVISNDATAITVHRILEAYKLTMARFGHKAIVGQNTIQCAEKLYKIVEADPTGERLDSTLSLIFDTWGYSTTSIGKLMVDVVSSFLARYERHFQVAWFTKKLRDYNLQELRAEGMRLRELRHGRISLKAAVLMQVVEAYNEGRRDGRLEI